LRGEISADYDLINDLKVCHFNGKLPRVTNKRSSSSAQADWFSDSSGNKELAKGCQMPVAQPSHQATLKSRKPQFQTNHECIIPPRLPEIHRAAHHYRDHPEVGHWAGPSSAK
jgi:hypothetical protein